MDTSTLALLLAFAAAQTAVPPPGKDPGVEAVPPGTPEDQALWKDAVDASNQILIERARAGRLQVKVRSEDYDGRLGALAGKAGSPDGAAAARERLLARWSESYQLMTRQWPVDPTRACRYQVLNMESAMYDEDPAKQGSTLPEARQNVKVCLEKARLVLSALARSSGEFEAAVAEADRLLAGTGKAPAAAGASAPPGKTAEEVR